MLYDRSYNLHSGNTVTSAYDTPTSAYDNAHVSWRHTVNKRRWGYVTPRVATGERDIQLRVEDFRTRSYLSGRRPCTLRRERRVTGSSGGARDFFLVVLWGCSAFYWGCYEIRVISYESHFSLLQHLPTISSHMFTRLLSNGSLGYIKSAIQIDRIIIVSRLLLTDAHKAAFTSDGQNGCSML